MLSSWDGRGATRLGGPGCGSGLGKEYFKVNKNEALLRQDGQESDLAGEQVELKEEPVHCSAGTQTQGVGGVSRITMELVLQHSTVDGVMDLVSSGDEGRSVSSGGLVYWMEFKDLGTGSSMG